MPRCRYCRADISFVVMASGRSMPVLQEDARRFHLALEQPGHPQTVVVTPNGQVVRGREGREGDPGVEEVVGWESHFAHCPGGA